jgi:predicted peptidase
MGTAAAAAWLAGSTAAKGEAATPALALGAPNSEARTTLIDKFRRESEGLQKKFEARTHKSDWVMPYRLYRPQSQGKLPLIVYLHGSGGLGDDNEKQLALGNIFGTRVWLLPENQKKFPCYVLVPQTDRGWVRYDLSGANDAPAKIVPGFGDGNRLALEIVESLRKEFAIDERRMYVTGQSMGGSGVWNILKHRPNYFAAAVPCCGAEVDDDGTGSLETPLWNFHGDSDKSVPVELSRDRIAARRKAGGHPIYTEYPGVDHNVWQWAFTEPALVTWLFEQRR